MENLSCGTPREGQVRVTHGTCFPHSGVPERLTRLALRVVTASICRTLTVSLTTSGVGPTSQQKAASLQFERPQRDRPCQTYLCCFHGSSLQADVPVARPCSAHRAPAQCCGQGHPNVATRDSSPFNEQTSPKLVKVSRL